MLLIFKDSNNNYIKTYYGDKDKLSVEDISIYDYNIYGEIIPSYKEYLIKITSKDINYQDLKYKKGEDICIYALSNNKNHKWLGDITINNKEEDLEDFFNYFKDLNKTYCVKNNLIEFYEGKFEDLNFTINNDNVLYNLEIKIK